MKTKQIVPCIVVFTLVCSLLLAQQKAVPARDPAQESLPVPESYVDRVRREGTVLTLTLRAVMRLALTNNLEIAIEDFNEDLNRDATLSPGGFMIPS